jgi:two-component system response regulator
VSTAPTSGIAILVVEADPGQRESTLLALRECCDPARIATAAQGGEALDFLLGRGLHAGRDTRKQPRLVIMAARLAQERGLDVLKAIRSDPLTQAVPVVMLASSDEKTELAGCYEAGANSVVLRSSDRDEMFGKMRRVYEFWVTVNEANRNSRV